MQFYINWKVISVSVTCSNTCHNIIVHILDETLCFCKAYRMTFLGTLSYAFSRSIKIICMPFFCPLHLSISCIIKKIASIVDLVGMNPNWFSVTLVTHLKRCSMILSHNFIVCVEVVLRHFHRCRYRSSPLWFFCWRGSDHTRCWLSGNTVDTRIYVIRAAGA
jgi:hypothetical protein